MGSFSTSINAFVKRTKVRADLVVRKLAMEALQGVVQMSPVDTGRFRGSWRVGLNQVDGSTSVAIGEQSVAGSKYRKANGSQATAQALSAGSPQIAAAKWGDTVYITNNVEYAEPLERGHSKQAPAGMLRVTFERLKAGLNGIVSSIDANNAGGSGK